MIRVLSTVAIGLIALSGFGQDLVDEPNTTANGLPEKTPQLNVPSFEDSLPDPVGNLPPETQDAVVPGPALLPDDVPNDASSSVGVEDIPASAGVGGPESSGLSESPGEERANNDNIYGNRYVEVPVQETILESQTRVENGRETNFQATRVVNAMVRYPISTDLDDLKLGDEARRSVVLAITAARHAPLLLHVKNSEGAAREKALERLKENYTEHYAIETWWRTKKLAELEAKLKKLRAELEQRDQSEEKYVDAAMTIATMHANGIAIEPPRPAAPSGGSQSSPGLTLPALGPADSVDYGATTTELPAPGFNPAPAPQPGWQPNAPTYQSGTLAPPTNPSFNNSRNRSTRQPARDNNRFSIPEGSSSPSTRQPSNPPLRSSSNNSLDGVSPVSPVGFRRQ